MAWYAFSLVCIHIHIHLVRLHSSGYIHVTRALAKFHALILKYHDMAVLSVSQVAIIVSKHSCSIPICNLY